MKPELPILIKARAKIADPANWGKGWRGLGPNGRSRSTCCAAEAIESVTEASSANRSRAYTRLAAVLGVHLTIEITNWNDAPERTHAQVLAAFDKAIASAS